MRDAGGESVAAADAVDVRSAALLLARLACNGHTLCDEELRPYGGWAHARVLGRLQQSPHWLLVAGSSLLASMTARAHQHALKLQLWIAGTPAGVGLFPLGAMVNHGEEPNAMQSFKGAAIEFRCAAGEGRACGRHGTAACKLAGRCLSQLLALLAGAADAVPAPHMLASLTRTPRADTTHQGAARHRGGRGGDNRIRGARGAAPRAPLAAAALVPL